MTLWDFAVDLYGQEGVAPACLEVQERFGTDVPLLLWAGWLAARQQAPDAAAIARADEAVAAWRNEVIHPLRAIRQRMKHGPAPAPSDRTEQVRDRVKAAELEAERLELELLEGFAGASEAAAAQPDPTEALALVLDHFAGARVDRAGPALGVIAGGLAAGRASG